MLNVLNRPHQDSKRQQREALADYWPLLPVAIVIIITATALVGPTPQPLAMNPNNVSLCLCNAAEHTLFVDFNDPIENMLFANREVDSPYLIISVPAARDCRDDSTTGATE